MIQTDVYSKLHRKIKLLWLFGDWKSIVEDAIPQQESLIELACYKIAALYQLGKIDEARSLVRTLKTVDARFLKRLLISGVYNCLAKASALSNQLEKSNDFFVKAIGLMERDELIFFYSNARRMEQMTQIRKFPRWTSFSNIESLNKKRKLFIDCGGYDGCSVIKFLLSNPDYDVITFEANPELWKYYDSLPAKLIKKSVYNYDGEIEFTIDPIDADGSSLIKEKKVDFYGKVNNDECPKINTECVDLSIFIKQQSEKYEEIILKLDVEGAEYAILNKMLSDGTIGLIDKLFAEFHWNKIGMKEQAHIDLMERLKEIVKIEYWDAQEFSVHGKDKRSVERRKILEKVIVN